MNAATDVTATAGWWRAKPAVPVVRAAGGRAVAAAATAGSTIAFRALIAFTFILLLSPQIYFPALGKLRIAFLAAIVAIGANLVERMGRRDALPFSGEIGIALVLLGWATLTLPVSLWPGGSLGVLTEQYMKAIAFFWLIGTIATSADRLRNMGWALVVCAIPLAMTGLKNFLVGQVLTTGVPGLTRIYGYDGGSGLVGNPNDLALMLNLIVPIAAALLLDSRRFAERAVAGGSLLLSVAAIVVTFSRAGFLTLAASLIMLFAVLIRRRSGGAATALLLLAITAPLLMPAGYLDRLSTITNINTDKTGSAQGRWKDLFAAGDVVVKNPILGVGIGQDVLALNAERGADWTSVHNAYLQYAVDLGLPGALLFISLHVMCFRGARAVERRAAADPSLRHLLHLAAGIQISLVAFAVAAMFHPIAYQFFFFTVAGMAVALKNTCRTELGLARLAQNRVS